MKRQLMCDQVEYALCNGKTYSEAYPNVFLAIDEDRLKILAIANTENEFITKLQTIDTSICLRIIDPWSHRPACPSVFPIEEKKNDDQP